MPWILPAAFLTFALGAAVTYHRPARDSAWFLPAFLAASLLAGWLWTVGARRCDTVAGLLFFSLAWDGLMVLAYYAGPLVLKGGGLGWQAYAAAGVTAAGLVWFKAATG